MLFSVWKDSGLEWHGLRVILRSIIRHDVLAFEIGLPSDLGFKSNVKSASLNEIRVELNDFGREFVDACRPPQKA